MSTKCSSDLGPCGSQKIHGSPYRQIRALHNDQFIIVYQAYNDSIADAAITTQKLNASPNFRPGRMTWIKPSWCWIMYRSAYSYKDPGQRRILALTMKRQHFISLLERGVLSHHPPRADGSRREESTVRIQWDPERTARLEVLPYRSIQIGIPGSLSAQWAEDIVSIEDVTDRARELKRALDHDADVSTEQLVERGLLPRELPFPIPEAIASRLAMTA